MTVVCQEETCTNSSRNPSAFAIASTLFFLVVFAAVALRVLTREAGSYDAAARLPLDESDSDEAKAGGR